MRITIAPLFLSSVIIFASCGKPAVERRVGKNQEAQKDTSVLRAADLAGHDGTKLRKKVEALKDASAKRNKALENVP